MNKLDQELTSQLRAIVGDENIYVDQETRIEYGHDETEDFNFPPAAWWNRIEYGTIQSNFRNR